jgi:hypothetical protein
MPSETTYPRKTVRAIDRSSALRAAASARRCSESATNSSPSRAAAAVTTLTLKSCHATSDSVI